MAEKILVSTAEIQVGISNYESAKSAKLDAINAMQSAVQTLDGYWDGPASNVFIAAFNALYSNLMNSEAIMDDAINELKKVAELVEAADTDVNNTVGQLETGPQFSF